jgi:hypothetical protein
MEAAMKNVLSCIAGRNETSPTVAENIGCLMTNAKSQKVDTSCAGQ